MLKTKKNPLMVIILLTYKQNEIAHFFCVFSNQIDEIRVFILIQEFVYFVVKHIFIIR